jgi:uncharacterized SAM-binding protein YcdF (DUF218 family)
MQTAKPPADEAYESLLLPIWQYLAISDQPRPSDVIFVFGGLDKAVPSRAADLYLSSYAPKLLVTGNVGPFSKDVFDRTEAEVFSDIIVSRGVPRDAVILEKCATNTLENVVFGMRALEAQGIMVTNAILVGKPFLMRRCVATFVKQRPEVGVVSCPPLGSLESFRDRSVADFARRLAAEVDRLIRYGAAGDIAEQQVPGNVRNIMDQIRQDFGS